MIVFVDLFDKWFDTFFSRASNEQSRLRVRWTWSAPRCSGNASEDARVSAACAAGEPFGYRCDVIVFVDLFDV